MIQILLPGLDMTTDSKSATPLEVLRAEINKMAADVAMNRWKNIEDRLSQIQSFYLPTCERELADCRAELAVKEGLLQACANAATYDQGYEDGKAGRPHGSESRLAAHAEREERRYVEGADATLYAVPAPAPSAASGLAPIPDKPSGVSIMMSLAPTRGERLANKLARFIRKDPTAGISIDEWHLIVTLLRSHQAPVGEGKVLQTKPKD